MMSILRTVNLVLSIAKIENIPVAQPIYLTLVPGIGRHFVYFFLKGFLKAYDAGQ